LLIDRFPTNSLLRDFACEVTIRVFIVKIIQESETKPKSSSELDLFLEKKCIFMFWFYVLQSED